MENIIIYGAGDLGAEFAWFLSAFTDRWTVCGFVDDALPAGTRVAEQFVLGDMDYLLRRNEKVNVLCAVSQPVIKKQIVEKLEEMPWIHFPTLIHPKALVAGSAVVGEGTVVGPGCTISVDTVLGRHALVNQNVSISHHAQIGDYAMIAPGCAIGGRAVAGEGAFLGMGCIVKPQVTISDYTVLGAGAVAVSDLPPYCTAVGVPARPIR